MCSGLMSISYIQGGTNNKKNTIGFPVYAHLYDTMPFDIDFLQKHDLCFFISILEKGSER